MILAACVKIEEKELFVGRTHAAAGLAAVEEMTKRGRDWHREVKGFLSDSGDFLSRAKAYIEAKECNQIVRNDFDSESLDSGMLDFTPEQLAQAQQIAKLLNSKQNETQDCARLQDMIL